MINLTKKLSGILVIFILFIPLSKSIIEAITITDRSQKEMLFAYGMSIYQITLFRQFCTIFVTSALFIILLTSLKKFNEVKFNYIQISILSIYFTYIVSMISSSSYGALTGLLLSIAVLVYPSFIIGKALNTINIFAIGYILLNVISIFLFPRFAIESDYTKGFLPFRFHGLSSHSNQLAPLLFFCVVWINEIARANRSNIKNIIYLVLVAISCVLIIISQSKTIIGVMMLYLAYKIYRLNSKYFFILFPMLITVIIYNLTTILGFVPDDIETLTGRNVVWEHTINKWSQNKIFGVNTELWNAQSLAEFYSLYNWTPNQSHNQFFQTLGYAGIVGILALMLFYFTSGKQLMKNSKNLNSVVNWLLICIFVRSITETPLTPDIYNEGFTIQFIILICLAARTNTEKTV